MQNYKKFKNKLQDYNFFKDQLIGIFPIDFRYSFVWEKHFELKNLLNDKGEG